MEFLKKYLLQDNVALLILIWLLLLLILPWQGFFLLNDSYVYEWNVRHFLENNFLLHPLTSPTLLFQTFLGSIIYLFKKDVSLLILLTSLFYILGVIYFYKIALYAKIKKTNAFFLSLILMFNPLYLTNGFSFMSDVYFISLFIISAFYFLQFLIENNPNYLFVTSILVTFCILSRQVGVLVLLAYLIVYFFKKRRFNMELIFFLIPVLVFFLYQAFYPKPLAYTYRSIDLTLVKLSEVSFFFQIIDRVVKSIYYIGFFVIPYSFAILLHLLVSKKIFKKRLIIAFAVSFLILSIISFYFWVTEKQLMFYIPNVLSYAGFQPQNLGFGVKQTIFVNSPVKSQALITVFCVISSSVFIALSKKINLLNNLSVLIVGIPGLFILLASLLFRDYFDRYLLVILPFILLYLGILVNRVIIKKYYFFFIAIFALISVIFEHDYLSFNKKIWEIPQKMKINPIEIKGTYEFEGYYRLDKIYNVDNPEYIFDRLWRPKPNEYKYILSYTNVEPYCTINKFHYLSLISANFRGKIELLSNCE